ncbi:MAG: glycosyltransferase family 4 protein [Kiritimatiellia bacterium]|nr:glycosyltransferase family 4 protein [Lentisphaerota bacterium]
MKILLLAPQPFYRERGTPIAVDLLLRALADRSHQVDVLTYHLGRDVVYPGVRLHRIPHVPGVRDVPPGFSLRKLLCDLWMLPAALRLAARGGYQLVHAVEESVFMAMLIKRIHGIPYIFDMDSCMPAQMAEKHPRLKLLAHLMDRCETAAIRGALAVAAVCDALADRARACRPAGVFLLRDISLLQRQAISDTAESKEHLRQELDFKGFTFLYIGNLEHYQGIDLLLGGFAQLLKDVRQPATLAIAGGTPEHIAHYKKQAATLGITRQTRFLGPQPVDRMGLLFQAADALVSPRIKGNNTPMKIYSYLDSGRPVLATNLPTHTQVMSPETACLVAPDPEAMAAGMQQLLADHDYGQRLANSAGVVAAERHSWPVFQSAVNDLYQWLDRQLQQH